MLMFRVFFLIREKGQHFSHIISNHPCLKTPYTEISKKENPPLYFAVTGVCWARELPVVAIPAFAFADCLGVLPASS